MPVYDLNNIAFLEHDIDHNLKMINSLYYINVEEGQLIYFPKTFVPNGIHWASNESMEVFNELIPIVKGLVKDMYSLIECIFKGQTGDFKKNQLESQYQYLKELRFLNNKFKHFNDHQVEITVVQCSFIQSNGCFIEVICNYQYDDKLECLKISDLINVYLNILIDKNIFKINK